jgi:hypothetical protein
LQLQTKPEPLVAAAQTALGGQVEPSGQGVFACTAPSELPQNTHWAVPAAPAQAVNDWPSAMQAESPSCQMPSQASVLGVQVPLVVQSSRQPAVAPPAFVEQTRPVGQADAAVGPVAPVTPVAPQPPTHAPPVQTPLEPFGPQVDPLVPVQGASCAADGGKHILAPVHSVLQLVPDGQVTLDDVQSTKQEPGMPLLGELHVWPVGHGTVPGLQPSAHEPTSHVAPRPRGPQFAPSLLHGPLRPAPGATQKLLLFDHGPLQLMSAGQVVLVQSMRHTPPLVDEHERPIGHCVSEVHGTSQWPCVQTPPAPFGPQAALSTAHGSPRPVPTARQARAVFDVHSVAQCEPVGQLGPLPAPVAPLGGWQNFPDAPSFDPQTRPTGQAAVPPSDWSHSHWQSEWPVAERQVGAGLIVDGQLPPGPVHDGVHTPRWPA